MAKKRKLNSKNPKYSTAVDGNVKVIKKRVHMCDVPTRDSSGNITKNSVKIPVYGVWYENDTIKVKSVEKWWKLNKSQLN